MQETYSIFRNLGYLARGANVISDALDNLGGKPLSDEQKRARARQQDEKLSVVAPAANLGVIVAPIVVLVILGAEQMYKLIAPVPMEHGSYFSGGVLEAWRGTVSPAATALMYAVLLLIRVAFTKFELWLAPRGSTQARH